MHQLACLGHAEAGVGRALFSRHGDLDHRRPIAGTDAAYAFHGGLHAVVRQALLQGAKHLVRSLRQAARVEAHLDLGTSVTLCGGANDWLGGSGGLPARQEVANGGWHFLGRGKADRFILNPHYGSQRAAAQAGDPLDSESSLSIGVRALGDMQVAAQGVLDPFGAAHVAGGAVAHMDDVLAARLVPEHVVESRDPADRRRRDLRGRADTL